MGAGSISKLPRIPVGRAQILVGCWPESPVSLLVLAWRPPSVPRHGALSNAATQLIKTQPEVRSAQKTGHRLGLPNHRSDVPFLFSSSLDASPKAQAQPQGGVYTRYEAQED